MLSTVRLYVVDTENRLKAETEMAKIISDMEEDGWELVQIVSVAPETETWAGTLLLRFRKQDR